MRFILILLIFFWGCDDVSASKFEPRDVGQDLVSARRASDVLVTDMDASALDMERTRPDLNEHHDIWTPGPDTGVFGGARPAKVILPKSYDPKKSYPLITLLHGYAMTAKTNDTYMGISKHVDKREFILILPDGLKDKKNMRYWNATDGCCDFNHREPDDISYLMGLVDEAMSRYHIDPKRIYFMGHSNGGFMSYTLACKYGDRIAAIASLSGTTFLDPAKCEHTGNVSVLHAHGTLDAVIRFRGATKNLNLNGYPGAEETVNRWVARNGCAPGKDGAKKNLSGAVIGKETKVKRWSTCADNTTVEFWKIVGGSHTPALKKAFQEDALDFLLSHSK